MSAIPENYNPADVGPEQDFEGFTKPDPDASKDDIASKVKRAFKPHAKPPKTKKPIPPMPRGAGFTPQLEALYAGIGAMVVPFDPICGQAVMQAAPKCAETLNDLAKQNEAVRRFLVMMLETSAIGAVVMAHAPIVMTIAMHHNPLMQAAAGQATAEAAEAFAQQNGHAPDGKDEQ